MMIAISIAELHVIQSALWTQMDREGFMVVYRARPFVLLVSLGCQKAEPESRMSKRNLAMDSYQLLMDHA